MKERMSLYHIFPKVQILDFLLKKKKYCPIKFKNIIPAMTFVRNILNDVIKLGCKEHWLWVMLVSFTLNHIHLFSPGVAMTGGKKHIAIFTFS